MSEELSIVEKDIEEFFIDLMTKRVMSMSEGIQDSSTRTVQVSPSTTRVRPSQPADEKRTKHRDDLVNAKLIPSILLAYLPPLSGEINQDSVPREFEYGFVPTYLPKGICAVRADQENIAALNFSDFNLGDRKVYNIISHIST
jgi:hypothetical protein